MPIQQNKLLVLGIMSGTSVDGLDLVIVEFRFTDHFSYAILAATTLEYNDEWKTNLKNAFYQNENDLNVLDTKYGEYIGRAAKQFIESNQLPVQLIGSHGHTIFHKPEQGLTLQIGDGKLIRDITDIPVVYNFRQQDVLLGGQGAPLVPIGDELLFGEYSVCLNLGGFSNVSLKVNDKRIAFDTGVCNMLLNTLAQRKHKPYDDRGLLARKGKILPQVLARWNQLDYFKKSPPKSLGREWFEENYLVELNNPDYQTEDLLRTSVQHICDTLHFQLREYQQIQNGKILVTGGGAHNDFLMELLNEKLNPFLKLFIPDQILVNYKEALIFAFLAYLNIQNHNNVLASVTGARHDHCSGTRALI